ncbi:MAG: ATP-binding cassette domain-containing protein [Parasporobacterium sp.]|nr:ATP-binding cassette domain-containing protein [Parasporobacterium sp.]
MTDNIIEIKDLHVTFEVRKKLTKKEKEAGIGNAVRAVDGVDLEFRRGEIMAVVGESGCGKTTLGKSILQLNRPSSGSIVYNGRDMGSLSKSELKELRSKLQMVFQDPYESLNPRQNVYQTLMEPLKIHRKDMPQEEKDKLIYDMMEKVGLKPVDIMSQRYPHHLSGGQRQRLAIAATMILKPEFVVADEPVSMLDVSIRAEIVRLLLDLQKSNDITYMFITHDLSLAWVLADRIAVFYLGKLMELGPADQVVHQSAHPYTSALVSVIPKVETEADDKKHVLEGETPSPLDMPEGCRFHTRCWYYKENGCPSVCREKQPELVDFGEGHCAACHFAKEVKELSK